MKRIFENRKDELEPFEHEVNLEALREMEEYFPMTSFERKSLRQWVYTGHSPDRNPWRYADGDGWELDYLKAYRRHHGYAIHIRYSLIED